MHGDFSFTDALLEKPKIKIQEVEFVKKYLPLFTKYAKENKWPIEYWLNIAQSPYNTVDVYDGGTYLYTVPPLLDSSTDVINGDTGLYEDIMQAQQKMSIHPKLGVAHMEHMTNTRLIEKKPDLDMIIQWNRIFSRYELPLIEIRGEVPESAEVAVNNPSTDADISTDDIQPF